jgi:methyl-accepting chemotaxis protein
MSSLVRGVQALRITSYQVSLAQSPEEILALEKSGDSIASHLIEGYRQQKSMAISDRAQSMCDKAIAAISAYNSLVGKWAATIQNGTAKKIPGTTVALIPEELRGQASAITLLNDEFIQEKADNAKRICDGNTVAFNSARTMSIAFLVAMALFALACGLYMTRSITKPLRLAVSAIQRGEAGDMTARVELDQKDEFGQVAKSINSFFAKMQKMVGDLKANSHTLAGASEELSAVSRQLASSSEETVNQSNTGASGAEEASVNAGEVAGAAEEMSTNMNTVAAAVEEMSASITDISSSAHQAREVSSQATAKAGEATTVMGKLGEAAKNIGQVTNAIKSIADKTNLLALNATIEAASAGEAGKGFAVVANEIKELANQSAKSADDIARRIDGMQSGTNQAIEVISSVSTIIGDINQSVTAIAGHVEQQTNAVNEIASNVSQASTGAHRVASAIGEVAKGAKEISASVGMVSQAAQQSAQGAGQVNQSAEELSKMAGELKLVTDQFIV